MILSAVRIGRYYLAAFILLWQPLATPAHGCSSVSACAGIVDGFFLDLIVGPVESSDAAATPPSPPALPVVSPRPPGGGAIVIPSPAAGTDLASAMPATEPEPTRPWFLEQGLVTGRTLDGGEAWMSFTESTDGDEIREAASPLARIGSFDGAEEWRRVRKVALAAFPAWPTGTVSHPVGMTLGCGSCAGGAAAEMTGTGMLEFGLAGTGTPGARVSRIRDMSLRAPSGPAVTGEMRFVFHTDDGPVATADKSWLRLDFGNYSADLRLRLLVWLHADGRAGGAFTGMTADPGVDPGADPGAVVGAVVGYFSGAGCAPACGVEN